MSDTVGYENYLSQFEIIMAAGALTTFRSTNFELFVVDKWRKRAFDYLMTFLFSRDDCRIFNPD